MRLIDQTKLVTAVSELAPQHRGLRRRWRHGLAADRGRHAGRRAPDLPRRRPGIADIKLAMTDGWTSGSGLGTGLTGAKRLVDEFELDSTVGAGTRITITRWTRTFRKRHPVLLIEDNSQIGHARRVAQRLAEQHDFDTTDAGRVALLATELGSNAPSTPGAANCTCA